MPRPMSSLAAVVAGLFGLVPCTAAVSSGLPRATAAFPSSTIGLAGARLPAQPTGIVADVARRALAAADTNRQACSIAIAVNNHCYSALASDAAGTDQVDCFCCDGATYIEPVFESCESYIVESSSANTQAYSEMSNLASFCDAAMRDGYVCGAGGGAAAATTSAPAAATALPTECTSMIDMILSCNSSDPNFRTKDVADAASCLCYIDGAYTTLFDDYVGTCVAYLSTADPSDYTAYAPITTLCAAYPPAESTSTSQPPSASASQPPSACASINALLSSCTAAVLGFTTMVGSDAASCLCYINGTYTTAIDDYYSECADYIQTAYPTDYTSYLPFETFCADFTPETVVSSPTPTLTSANDPPPGCTSAVSIIQSCQDSIDGFTTMDDRQAASCLCYAGGSYTTAFDDFLAECAAYVMTADPSDYASYAVLETLCEAHSPTTAGHDSATESSTASAGGGDEEFMATLGHLLETTSTTSVPTTTPASTSSTTASANVGAKQVSGGLATWLGIVLPFIL